uniref:DENN domain-containing protein 5B n=1 Tax=Syphacia muris TaxID=451379 RepID=A0A0N5AA87_9BILA
MVMSAAADSCDLVTVPGPSTSNETYQQNSSELTLIDYFVVAGYDATVGLQVELFILKSLLKHTMFLNFKQFTLQVVPGVSGLDSVNDSTPCPPLEQSYVASIQVHYPETRKGRPFPSEILSLCLPKGLRFYTQSNVPRHEVHTFANIREDGVRLDGTALIFYEEVTDQQLCQKMAELQAEHVKALTAQDKVFDRAHVPPGTVSGGTHTLPRNNKKDRRKRTSFYDLSRSTPLYVSKCICVVTRIPVVSSTTHLLNSLYDMIKSSTEPSLPLESYIYWMLNEVPLPAPGSTLKICLSEVDIVLQRPAPGELPFYDYSLNSLFNLIIVDKFLRLFSCFLLEHQILLCSKSLSRLMLVAESLCLLAFPFRWQLTYVPILPYSQLKFMEAPVPYIMGLCYEEEIPEQIFQSNVCVFDIDTGELEMPEDVPLIPDKSEMAHEVAAVLSRFEEQNNSSGAYVRSREINKLTKKQKGEWFSKRMSRSFDDDALTSLYTEEHKNDSLKSSRKGLTTLPLDDLLKQSEVLARVAAIARRAGVDVQMEKIEKELQSNDSYTNSPICRRYFSEMKLNNAIREIFLNRLAWLLYSYEHFVITTNTTDKDLYFASRDSLVNFDKAAFLSDQPDSNLPFLAAFLETQMFASFVDAKIVSQWEASDQNLQLFDARIQTLKEIHGLQMVRTPTYEKALPVPVDEEAISKREETLDYIVPQPHPLDGAIRQCYKGKFPELNGALLEGNKSYTPQPSPWKQRHRRLRPKFQKELSLNNQSSQRSSTYFANSPKQIAQQNLKFVDQLLRETKAKTKRMLVEKMGKEAVQLGHTEASVNGLEENTLVASFCDLLERVWAHGLIKKQGKSSLWAHVLHHQELEKTGSFAHPASVRNSLLAPDIECGADEEIFFAKEDHNALAELAKSIQKELEDSAGPAWSISILRAASFLCDKISSASNAVQPKATLSGTKASGSIALSSSFSAKLERSHSLQRPIRPALHKTNSFNGLDFTPNWSSFADEHPSASPRRRIAGRTKSPDTRYGFPPLPTHIAYDLKNVLRMTEIKTDLGFARAFVRLSLERKLLHRHLKTILSNTSLLHQIYKRYAFLRCEDEKEQFLYHILSLNAAEFRCFTNTFCKTKMQYRVLLATGNSRSILDTPIWVQIAGSLCATTAIDILPGVIDFKFDHVNLGILSTLRIGRNLKDVSNASNSKWYLDYALVRNEVTGQTYQFNCGRWFGRDVDDGSLERLLVAEVLPQLDSNFEEIGQFQNGVFERSKSHSRSATPTRARSPSASCNEILSTKSSNKFFYVDFTVCIFRFMFLESRLTEIQRQLGEAVNAIVKHLYSGSKSRSDLTPLLCAPDKGLVSVLVSVFLYGRQDPSWSSRFFKHYYPWDYIERVCSWFSDLLRTEDAKRLTREQRKLILYACCLVRRIASNTSLGKDGKFQLFVIITLRDHILAGLLPLMARTPITAQLYEEPSFLRSPHYLSYLSKLLNSLNDFQFRLEKSLTYGFE